MGLQSWLFNAAVFALVALAFDYNRFLGISAALVFLVVTAVFIFRKRQQQPKQQPQLQSPRSPTVHLSKSAASGEGAAPGETKHNVDMLKYTQATLNYTSGPPITKEILRTPGAFLVRNLMSKDEAAQLIEISEAMGYADSPLRNLGSLNATTAILSDQSRRVRTSQRVMFDAGWEKIAKTLNDRLLPFLPKEVQIKEGGVITTHWRVHAEHCISSRWRCNRYNAGCFFKPHFDAGYVFSKNRKTLLTFILYLNDGFEGGCTTFYPDNKQYEWSSPVPGLEEPVVPEVGMALIFFQDGELSPRHEGSILKGDKPKYIMRSDLTYDRTVPL